jgi:hypothetical protein
MNRLLCNTFAFLVCGEDRFKRPENVLESTENYLDGKYESESARAIP